MSNEKKCGTTYCKLYNKWTEDNCGKMVEGRKVELCQGYTETPRPQYSSGSSAAVCCTARKFVELFICKLIDECEGDIISEEYLQARYAEFLKKYELL